MSPKQSKIHQIGHILPTKLSVAMNCFGVPIEEENLIAESDKPHKPQNCFVDMSLRVKLAIFLSVIPLLLLTFQTIVKFKHHTVTLTVFFDIIVYLTVYYTLLFKRRDIVHCIQELVKIPHQLPGNRKYEPTSVFLAFALIFSLINFGYGIFFFYDYIKRHPAQTNFEIITQIVEVINFTIHCLFIFLGISIHTVLFVFFSALIYDRLLGISNFLEKITETNEYTLHDICQQRIFFCNMQKVSPLVDGIFNKIIFMWLLRILIRCCLSGFQFLTTSWTSTKRFGSGMSVFDTVYDVLHLLTISFCGGRMKDGTEYVMESLIQVHGKNHPQFDVIRKEIHFFVSIVGHSNIELTALKIFSLTRGTAVTLIGSIISYYVLIYQMAPKNVLPKNTGCFT